MERKRPARRPATKKPALELEKISASLLEPLMSGLFAQRSGNALDRAQEMIYDAWELASPGARVEHARKALETSPDCADAFVILARDAARSLTEAEELYRQGVAAGERALGPETFQQDVGHFWGLLETRPYMRARVGLAMTLWAKGESLESIGHLRELLRLNPGDNQGIRYLLLTALLSVDDQSSARQLLAEYGDDWSLHWLYTKLLLKIAEGDTGAKAEKLLKDALKCNRHVPGLLTAAKPVPKVHSSFLASGGEDEAAEYTRDNRDVWRRMPAALEWLRARTAATPKLPRRPRLRP